MPLKKRRLILTGGNLFYRMNPQFPIRLTTSQVCLYFTGQPNKVRAAQFAAKMDHSIAPGLALTMKNLGVDLW